MPLRCQHSYIYTHAKAAVCGGRNYPAPALLHATPLAGCVSARHKCSACRRCNQYGRCVHQGESGGCTLSTSPTPSAPGAVDFT